MTTILTRSTAKVDDIICIAGNLGFAHTGLTALEKGFELPEEQEYQVVESLFNNYRIPILFFFQRILLSSSIRQFFLLTT